MNKRASFSERVSQFLVKYRRVWLILFLVFVVVSLFLIGKTKIVYDLSGYLPKDSHSKEASEILKEFNDKGTISVLLVGDIDKVNAKVTDIGNLDGVSLVIFDETTSYINNEALLTIQLEGSGFEGIENILEALKNDEAYYGGALYASYASKEATAKEIISVMFVIGLVIIIVLLLASRSYFELVLLIITFGVSAVINLGTNFLLGEISYLTNIIGMILQLVLSIDFSLVMLHRYLDEREKNDPKEAATQALKYGMKEIFASSLTTISGVIALTFMSNPIGYEIGFALAKGIFISLLTVVFLMPGLLVATTKVLEKTKHRPLLPKVEKPAKFLLKYRYIVLAVFIVLIGVGSYGQTYKDYSFDMTTEATKNNTKRISDTFGEMNPTVIILPKSVDITELAKDISEVDGVNSVQSLALMEVFPGVTLKTQLQPQFMVGVTQALGLPLSLEDLTGLYIMTNGESVGTLSICDLIWILGKNPSYAQLISGNPISQAIHQFETSEYQRIILNINKSDASGILKAVDDVEEILSGKQFYIVNETLVYDEMRSSFDKDNLVVMLLTIAFVFIIVSIAFRSITIPIITIVCIQTGIWLNFLIPAIGNRPINFIGYLVISAIQMGATIDYAIILTSRYRQLNDLPLEKSIVTAVSQTFTTIITSGSILVLTGFCLSLISSEPALEELGTLLGVGTLLSVLLVTIILPSLLYVSHKLINKTSIQKSKA